MRSSDLLLTGNGLVVVRLIRLSIAVARLYVLSNAEFEHKEVRRGVHAPPSPTDSSIVYNTQKKKLKNLKIGIKEIHTHLKKRARTHAHTYTHTRTHTHTHAHTHTHHTKVTHRGTRACAPISLPSKHSHNIW